MKKMKKTIDAIHSFGKKISSGKNYKTSIKGDTIKLNEPKTVKKGHVNKDFKETVKNYDDTKPALLNKQIVERINTVSRKKQHKKQPIVQTNNFFGSTIQSTGAISNERAKNNSHNLIQMQNSNNGLVSNSNSQVSTQANFQS